MVKNCRILIIFLFFMTSSFVTTFAFQRHTEKFYVNDFANVLSQEVEDYIFLNSRALDEKTSVQVVVTTVQSLEDKDIETFSLEMFRDWKIGGLLILLVPEERQIRIEVGNKVEGIINDAKAGRFQDTYAIPYFKENNWDEGIKQLYSAVISEVYKGNDMEVPDDVEESYSNVDDSKFDYVQIILILIFILIFGVRPFIFGSIFNNGGRRFFDRFGNGHSGGGGFFGSGGGSSGGGASRRF